MKRKVRSFSGTKEIGITNKEREHRAVSQEAAIEGMVLLKNEQILPLDPAETIAIFGAGAGKTIKGGTGSGDVCEREVISIYDGMKAANIQISSEDWILDYNRIYDQARLDWKDELFAGTKGTDDFFENYAENVFKVPAGRPITEEDCGESDVAIYVISRIAGEGADRKLGRGDYELTQNELEDLKVLTDLGKDIVLLINSGGLINLQEILCNPQVKAILHISQPGMEGGHAVTKILFGQANPSGKLTDSWPLNYEDVPNANTFSYMSGDITKEFYEEGIYVGYRYFDSFDVDVAYCFGHGLSYTTFSMDRELTEMEMDENAITLTVPVINRGDCAGKEVVQVYAVCPQKIMAKEHRRLVGFAKTKMLEPAESEKVMVKFSAKDLASFSEEHGAWILEEGTYYFFIGNSLDDGKVAASLSLDHTFILEETGRICPLQEQLTELVIPEDLATKKYQAVEEEALAKGIEALPFTPVIMEKIERKTNKYEKMAKELVDQLTDKELIYMSVGEVSRGHDVALGATGIMVPGAAGETSSILEESYDFPAISMADGPAGIRVLMQYLADEKNGQVYTQGFVAAIEKGFFAEPLVEREGTVMYYQYCTAFPIGTMLAQTWNEEMIHKVGKTVGQEMVDLGISWWLAPGMNIHRNPLCGRNFEYYSEDPLVSGKIATAMTKGVQSMPGVGTTIKHFACNNLEDNRFGSDSILSERTLREIYIRGFEIAVKESQPMALMSSYNLINGIHAANNKDLLLNVLREEWGYKGMVMTDWTTTSRGSEAWMCPKAGNDLIMPGAYEDFDNIEAALKDGRLTKQELKDSVARLVCVIYQTLGFEDADCYGQEIVAE